VNTLSVPLNDLDAFAAWLDDEYRQTVAVLADDSPDYDRVCAAMDAMRDISTAQRLVGLFRSSIQAS